MGSGQSEPLAQLGGVGGCRDGHRLLAQPGREQGKNKPMLGLEPLSLEDIACPGTAARLGSPTAHSGQNAIPPFHRPCQVQAPSLLAPWALCPLNALLLPGQKHGWTLCWMSPSHWTRHPDHVLSPRAALAALGKFYTNAPSLWLSFHQQFLTDSVTLPLLFFYKGITQKKEFGRRRRIFRKKKNSLQLRNSS